MKLMRFRYTNWRGEEHIYLVNPFAGLNPGLACGTYKVDDRSMDDMWVLNADVVERDGKPRPGRRAFILGHLQDVQVVTR